MRKSLAIITGILFFGITLVNPNESKAQEIDSTQIGKEYPYVLPILGKKAYAKGYVLQKPFGIMASSLWTKQGIVLENFEMDFVQGPGQPDFDRLDWLTDLIIFGPSEGRINTINFRGDAWVLPFLNVGGYYGRVWGDQTIVLEAPIAIESTTDINGQYYGFGFLIPIPIGPLVLMADYNASWTTNERLDKPVLVHVTGGRLVKRFMTKKRGRFFAAWAGTQFQFLASRTSGNIPLNEALDPDGSFQQKLDDWYNGLDPNSPIYDRATELYNELSGLINTTVYYQFDKRLEYNWQFILGLNYQHSPNWQFRAEWGFLRRKAQINLGLNYRFGF